MSKILVKSKPERFRRAGIEFTREGVVLDTSALKKEQVEAIKAETMLAVSDVADEDDGKKGAKK